MTSEHPRTGSGPFLDLSSSLDRLFILTNCLNPATFSVTITTEKAADIYLLFIKEDIFHVLQKLRRSDK